MAPVLFDPLMIPVLQGGAEPDPANPGTPLMDPGGGGAAALNNGYQLTDGISVFTLINGSTRLTQRINAGETTLAQWSTGTKPPFSNDGPLPPPAAAGGTTTSTGGTGTGTGTGGTGAPIAPVVAPAGPPSFQTIRGTLEKATSDALVAAGVAAADVFFDGVGQSRPSADSTWAQISISFTDVKQDLIGCDCGDDIRGTVQCNIYTPEGYGSKSGEDIAAGVLRAWSGTMKWDAATRNTVRCRDLQGPRAINSPTNDPHRCHVITAAFNGTST